MSHVLPVNLLGSTAAASVGGITRQLHPHAQPLVWPVQQQQQSSSVMYASRSVLLYVQLQVRVGTLGETETHNHMPQHTQLKPPVHNSAVDLQLQHVSCYSRCQSGAAPCQQVHTAPLVSAALAAHAGCQPAAFLLARHASSFIRTHQQHVGAAQRLARWIVV